MIKNKNIFYVLLFSSFSFMPQSQSIGFDVKADLKKLYDTYIESCYGTENVSPATEDFIRSLAQKMGITKKFVIKRMSQNVLQLGLAENAFVYHNHVYIHEPFLNLLPLPEKEFLICHELSHLFHNHTEKRSFINTVYKAGLVTGIYILGRQLCNKITYHDSNKFYKLCASASLLGGYIYLGKISFKKMMQTQEFEADKKAADVLGDSSGGLSFFQRLAHINPRSEKNDSATHPSLESRINAIK